MTPSPSTRSRGSLLAGIVLTLAILYSGCGGTEPQQSDRASGASAETRTPRTAADPAKAARADARRLTQRGNYAAAAAALAEAGLDTDADRVRRRGARALNRSARHALTHGRFKTAKRLATQSRRLRKTTAAATVIASASTAIARAEAAEREHRRLQRIADDQRTCTSSEKAAVRNGDGIPAGCEPYAAEREQEESPAANDCDPNYSGACLKPDSPDYDCAGGSGDGPDYTGPVQVVGDDPYDLDRDSDGSACEG